MKFQNSELSSTIFKTRRKLTPTFIPILTATLLLTIIPLYFSFSHQKPNFTSNIEYRNLEKASRTNHIKTTEEGKIPIDQKTPSEDNKYPKLDRKEKNSSNIADGDDECDIFSGEWVPNQEGPYYTNETCDAIQEHQNCMRFGRPDTNYLRWRWKPDGCELSIFDPRTFLEMVKGKSLAFVGDSVARNHMQSLICLLSRVARPLDMSHDPTAENRLYTYPTHDFNITIISSPYLIKTRKTDPNDNTRPYNLYLDEPDATWTDQIHVFDYVIISAGQWFFRPTYFYLNRTLVGCLYCPEPNVTHMASLFSYRWAFKTVLRGIEDAVDKFNGVVYLRTFVPSHFEGGPWDKGGDCVRTSPFKRNETVMESYSSEMYRIQVEELGIIQKRTRGKRRFRLFDATKAMLLRPDGHPSKYGHRPAINQTIPNDCVHWCLPGPIDAWNDMLQELLRRQ